VESRAAVAVAAEDDECCGDGTHIRLPTTGWLVLAPQAQQGLPPLNIAGVLADGRRVGNLFAIYGPSCPPSLSGCRITTDQRGSRRAAAAADAAARALASACGADQLPAAPLTAPMRTHLRRMREAHERSALRPDMSIQSASADHVVMTGFRITPMSRFASGL